MKGLIQSRKLIHSIWNKVCCRFIKIGHFKKAMKAENKRFKGIPQTQTAASDAVLPFSVLPAAGENALTGPWKFHHLFTDL